MIDHQISVKWVVELSGVMYMTDEKYCCKTRLV